MEAFNFTVANEDHNCYTFDMRKLDIARNVHKGHVAAVLGIDYSPTGQEFVTGSYDKTIRIFPTDKGHAREVYHTKRMQRIFSVAFSGNGEYVFAGSDDTNIRVWKAVAAQNMAILSPRQKEALQYQEALIERYKDLPEIGRIYRKRHIPKAIKGTQKLKGIIKQSQLRKEANVRKHSKAGAVPFVPERKKGIITTQK